jgi:hypothetical protein
MADVNKLSDRVIEYAERASAMSDAAQGKKRIRTNGMARWLVLPAAGAGLYAMARSKTVTRQAKGALDEAKSRAAELPDELLGLVRQASKAAGTSTSTSTSSSSGNGASQQRKPSPSRRRSTRARASSR